MKNRIMNSPEIHTLTQHEVNKRIMAKDKTIDYHIHYSSTDNNVKLYSEKRQNFNEFVKKIQRFNEDISTYTKPRLYKDYCFHLKDVFGNCVEVKQDECAAICTCKEKGTGVKQSKRRTERVINLQNNNTLTKLSLNGSSNFSAANGSNLKFDAENKSDSGSAFSSKFMEICNIEPWLRRYLILNKFITAARKIILRNRLIKVLNVLKKVTKSDIRNLSKQRQNNYNVSYANIFRKFVVQK